VCRLLRLLLACISILAICGPLAACGSGQAGGSSFTQTFSSGESDFVCNFPSFNLPTDNPNPLAASPEQALNEFLASGSIHGAGGPITTASQAGYPTGGWRETNSTAQDATFMSGSSQIDVAQIKPSSWVVVSGKKNC
jgi:hypothetical protein